ncbi:MAG: ABC transporter permease, partial [Myxococcales bacterium]
KRILLEVMVQNSVGLFLIMPVFLPVLVASQALAGEKERRTLEPLLAAPISPAQLVLGKTLAAMLPALAISTLAFAVFAVGADLITYPLVGRLLLPDGMFFFAVLVLAPLLSFLGTTLSVAISARVGDSRLAQTLSGLVVMPFAAVVVLQVVGLLQLGPGTYLGLAVGALAADVVMLRLAVRLFDRERLLTRWA